MFTNCVVPRRTLGAGFWGGDFDRLFHQVFSEPSEGLSTRESGDWQSHLAVWEKDGVLNLELEIPGVARDDVELTAENGTLRIAGQRKAPQDEEGRTQYYNERRYGAFERLVRLPKQFDLDTVEAQLAEGVLHITLQKVPEAQSKRIEVK